MGAEVGCQVERGANLLNLGRGARREPDEPEQEPRPFRPSQEPELGKWPRSDCRSLGSGPYCTHSTLWRGPASSIRSISSGVTGGGAAAGSSTGVQTSRNQPSMPAGV